MNQLKNCFQRLLNFASYQMNCHRDDLETGEGLKYEDSSSEKIDPDHALLCHCLLLFY